MKKLFNSVRTKFYFLTGTMLGSPGSPIIGSKEEGGYPSGGLSGEFVRTQEHGPEIAQAKPCSLKRRGCQVGGRQKWLIFEKHSYSYSYSFIF